MKRLSLLIGLIPLLIASAELRANHLSEQLYGVTFFGNEFISIDAATGNGTVVGSLGSTVSPYGLAARFGSLYTFNPNNGQVQQIDPATGQVTGGIDIGVGPLLGEGDITFRSDGLGFLTTALDANFNPVNQLYSFDITAGTSQIVGSTRLTVDGLAFDGSTLYALAQGEGSLFQVDLLTAGLTQIGSLGVDQNSPLAGLAINGQGTLYGAIDDRLYTIDKSTGAAMPVDAAVLNFGPNISSVSGIAFVASVPDISPTAMLLVLGVGSLLLVRAEKRTAKA